MASRSTRVVASRGLDTAARLLRRMPASRVKVRLGRTFGGLWCAAAGGRLVETEIGSRWFVLDPRSRTEAEMLWNGRFDPEVVALLRAACGPGSTFIDIGANVGLVLIQMLGAADALIAFEPVQVNFEHLTRAVELNHAHTVITCHRAALGDTDGWLELVKDGPSTASGNAVPHTPGVDAEVERVPVRRLDDVLAQAGVERVDAMKIDVEGLEVSVLHGATRTIQGCRPVIFGEFNNALMPKVGTSFSDVWAIFEPLDYVACSFRSDHELDIRSAPSADLGNVVLIPTEKVDRLEQGGYVLR